MGAERWGAYYTLALPLTVLDDRVAERILTSAASRFSGSFELCSLGLAVENPVHCYGYLVLQIDRSTNDM